MIAGDERVREIFVEGPVDDIRLRVVEGNVMCYGASMEGKGGITVDNFSVRSNNGHAIFGTSAKINRQADEMLHYDLVVLQYGLNIMQAERRNYSKYRDQLRDMIAYAERCFPQAAILVLGVSDRWVKDAESGVYGPMSSVGSMKSYQRKAAEQSAVSFWPTSDAMTLYGGMPGFVSNGWAAKDYTHINFAGGKRVGEELHRSIVKSAYDRLKSGNSQAPTATAKPRVQPIKVETKPAEINNGVTFVAPAETKPAVTETQDAATTNEGGSTEQGASDIIVEQQTENLVVSDSVAMQSPVVELQEETMVEREQPAEVESDIEAEVEAVVETEAQREVVVEDAPQEVPVSESEDDSAVAEDDEFFREVL
jgi:lysophospholipase L1-like esterase